jgi:hypothetical protein
MEETLRELEELKNRQAEIEPELKQLNEREKELKKEIAVALSAKGIKRDITPSGDYLVVISEKRDMEVDDEPTVKMFLQSRGLLEECTRLDLLKVKKYGKAQEIPGMIETMKEVVSVRSNKVEQVEKYEPEESMADFRARVREARGE